jgi:hypothetical protein
VWCDGAEMNIFRRHTPARVVSPAAACSDLPRKEIFFIIPTAARAGFPDPDPYSVLPVYSLFFFFFGQYFLV